MAKGNNTISKSDQALNNVLHSIQKINRAESRGEDLNPFNSWRPTPTAHKPAKLKDSGLTAKISEGVKRDRKPSVRKLAIKAEKDLIALSLETGVPIAVLRINPNLRAIKK